MQKEARDPQIGDPVILRGAIVSIDEGVALVEIYRTWPVGISVPVQCGALEHDESAPDGGTQSDEAVRIADAVNKATGNPGRTIHVEGGDR